MRLKTLPSLLSAIFLLTLTPYAWSAPKYKVLHAFTGGSDGGTLWGSLLLDSRGNVYGTTSYGGDSGGGTIFELTPKPGGGWSETTLWGFDGTDGTASTAGLTFDSHGNLYGTTGSGGQRHYGTAFELTPQPGGTWTETVLHSFYPLDEGGCCPYAGVVADNASNLYGTVGGVFELSPGAAGWGYGVLHVFCEANDGCDAYAGVILDPIGNLYGTTEHGGGSQSCGGGCGTVYKLHPEADDSWKETILYSFQAGSDGAGPGVGALVLDGTGNLYGTTAGGGAGYGVAFKLTPRSGGHWKETVLYAIPGGTKGDHPGAGVVMDKAGDLYGTTIAGGPTGCGVVYKLAPQSNAKWKYTVLHGFTGADGCEPDANLILDNKGNLYGTAATGGAGGYGVAFEVTP
jgi:uncharacterized repeat protein (TIGR03803 family)